MSELEAEMDFASMKVNDLKKELKARGLSVTGNKTELIERLQMSMMGSNDSDILGDANDLLEGGDDDDDIGEDSVGLEPEPEVKKPGPASKKKVAIKRDTALPVVTVEEPPVAKPVAAKPAHVPVVQPAPVEEKKTEEPPKAAAEPTTAESAPKAVKAMTDAERAAARAARFGAAAPAAVDTDEKKLARAQRFGLPVTAAGTAANGKIGAAPTADLDTLKKRAERFGQTTSNTMKKLELDEKIKKRQERFGEVKNGGSEVKKAKIEVNKSLVEPKVDPAIAEKLKKRAERFGVASS